MKSKSELEESKSLARQFFQACGYAVSSVPETAEKRADLVATDVKSTFLIEAKDKNDLELTADQIHELSKGEVVTDSEPMNQNNRIAKILTEARDQLDATPTNGPAFRLIWFHAEGRDRELFWDRAFATFYGSVFLFPVKGKSETLVQCYYFDYATSLKIVSVDGLILSNRTEAQLLLNEYSPNVHSIKQTAIYRRFLEFGAVVDPIQQAITGQILTFKHHLPRKNDEERLRILESETGEQYRIIRFQRHAARLRTGTEGSG